jgi:inner membrane protein
LQKTLLFRVVIIVLLILALWIPLALVQGVVSDRQHLQRQVEETIATTSTGPQRIAGPLLIVPYVVSELVVTTDDKGREKTHWGNSDHHAVFLPEMLDYDGEVGIEEKYKGLYKSLLYQTKGVWKARFNVPVNLGTGIDAKHATKRFMAGKAFVAVGLSDVRGLRGTPKISWDATEIEVSNSANWPALGDGLHAIIGALDAREARLHEMTMQLDIAGTSMLSIAPLGKTTTVQLRAAWPHPNFGGRFLPTSKQIDDKGFVAKWEVSQLSSKNAALVMMPARADSQPTLLETFDVAFIEPVNIYLKAERAVKYGILFVVLTFAAFFLLETMKNLRIHPLQYGLVGLALAIFFLLLVSLSEHIPFLLAYLSASVACISLIAYYLSHVLGGAKYGLFFGASLTALYGVLYGLLLSEDNALVLGSLLLFVVLAVVMLVTRKFDWFKLGRAA